MRTRCDRCEEDNECKSYPHFVGTCLSSDTLIYNRGTAHGWRTKTTYSLSDRRLLHICAQCQHQIYLDKRPNTPKAIAIWLIICAASWVVILAGIHWFRFDFYAMKGGKEPPSVIIAVLGLLVLHGAFVANVCIYVTNCTFGLHELIEKEAMKMVAFGVAKNFPGKKVVVPGSGESYGVGDMVVFTAEQARLLMPASAEARLTAGNF